MSWTLIVPLKPEGARKTRLRDVLSDAERTRLGESWFAHVVDILGRVEGAKLVVLSAERPSDWEGGWRRDEGRGLNPELQAARAELRGAPIAILHADLPHLRLEDVEALLEAAERRGCAIAPDRHGTGTNGLAIADRRPFRFAFGPMSFERHSAEAGAGHEVVERPGLALDVDTPDDLQAVGRQS